MSLFANACDESKLIGADRFCVCLVGQAVSMMLNEKTGLEYAIKMAKKEHHKEALSELLPLSGKYPTTDPSKLDDLFLQRKWLAYFGGVVHGERNYQKIFEGITAVENKLYVDSLDAAGEILSIRTLWPTLLRANLFKSIPRINVPVYFIAGKYDYNTNSLLVKQYFNFISAPRKKLIWFERSAHVMPFEEPEKFNQTMNEIKTEVMKAN